MLNQLAQALSQGSAEAIGLAIRLGTDARPAVIGALQSPNMLSRHLAVGCLRNIRDPRDMPVYLSLLSDPALTVRLQAGQGILENHAAIPVIGQLLTNALKEAKDPEIRIALATALGDRPDTSVPALADLETQQTDPTVRAQLIAALAKQGSAPHIEAFHRFLMSSRGDARAHWLSLSEYVGASWLLPDLAQMMDDEENLIPLSHCHSEGDEQGNPPYLRTCDYAARIISAITHETPSFADENGFTQLTVEQRGVMREIAIRQSPTPPNLPQVPGAGGGLL